jgi:adenosylcobinamide-phosphate synthase
MLFYSVFFFCVLTAAMIVLDRVIGDPPSLPHPVRWIGALLNFVEPRARKYIPDPFLAGSAASLAALFIVYAAVKAALAFPHALASVIAAYLLFSGMAAGQLLQEGKNALKLLEANDIPAARAAIGYLVSRDVSNADETELARALAETLAENINDAFVAPLFWYVFTGPVGLWLYKTASTMDSMWGYPHEPWTRFGTFAARLDDILAYIPARLTACCVLAVRNRAKSSQWLSEWPKIRGDAKKMKSPNAGWPMAAFAWACGAAMGGKTVYTGTVVDKPILGPEGELWTAAKLRTLIGLVTRTADTAFIALIVAGVAARTICRAIS